MIVARVGAKYRVQFDLGVANTRREAWNTVRRSAELGELVCIAGSFYLAAELRELVLASSKLDR